MKTPEASALAANAARNMTRSKARADVWAELAMSRLAEGSAVSAHTITEWTAARQTYREWRLTWLEAEAAYVDAVRSERE